MAKLRFNSYKDECIALRKAISALKRGKPTDYDLEVLGCPVDKFYTVNQYLVANNFEVKDRANFIKRLEKFGIDLFDIKTLKKQLDTIREQIELNPECQYLNAKESILGNIIYSPDKLSYFDER